ncbi:helix-turn-helix domain-containing protein [Peptoanaerobacter stomatis]
MNFNVVEFECSLLRNKKSKKDIADCLGINVTTLYRKINGESDFFREEIQKICKFLSLKTEEKEKIFFN